MRPAAQRERLSDYPSDDALGLHTPLATEREKSAAPVPREPSSIPQPTLAQRMARR